MIAFVSGILSDSTEDVAVVDVSGVGYRVLVSPGTLDKLPAVGTPVKLYTYFCVREDALLLYGFLTKEELGLFKQLITVSGIGPKAGLSLLSVMSVDDLRFAIFSADARAIAKAPGVGKKTAERLVLELKDKIGAPGVLPDAETYEGQEAGMDLTPSGGGSARDEAVRALIALGYPAQDAVRAVRTAADKCTEEADTEHLLSAALKELI